MIVGSLARFSLNIGLEVSVSPSFARVAESDHCFRVGGADHFDVY